MNPVDSRVQAAIRRVLALRGMVISPFTLMEFATMLKAVGCGDDELAVESAASILAPAFKKAGLHEPLKEARSVVKEIVEAVFGDECSEARQA